MGNRSGAFFGLLILVLGIHGCVSLNSEGVLLLRFRENVAFDPSGVLNDWNPNDCDPCSWSGVGCFNSEVVMLNLTGCNLEGVLAPELGNLTQLRVLDLSENHISGAIPSQIGHLTKLEVLDLRDNNMSGTIPADLGGLKSLKCLLLRNNRFQGHPPLEIEMLSLLVTDIHFDDTLATSGNGCLNRKLGHCVWEGELDKSEKPGPSRVPSKWSIIRYLKNLQHFTYGNRFSENRAYGCNLTDSPEPSSINVRSETVTNVRRVLAEDSSNFVSLPPIGGAPLPSEGVFSLPSRSSGSFSAVPHGNKLSPSSLPLGGAHAPPVGPNPDVDHIAATPTSGNSGDSTKLAIWIFSVVILLIFAVFIITFFKSISVTSLTTIGPWKSGLSGQLQKAFITGVPKLNRDELETACEDFSNLIIVLDGVATLYKGILSSGVEIAVVSTSISSAKQWSKRAELAFRKQIDSLSRVNHKNFVNLIGFCEEEEPFTRMMVFEYAPNGALFDHLHVKDYEHLDWNSRMRIVMGTAYCLQYMHELNPPAVHSSLNSKGIFLTDDYAAKIGDVGFWLELVMKANNRGENESGHSELPPPADVETNIHSFGMLLLEIISGKLEKGNLVQYLSDKNGISNLIDPSLKSFKENELEVVCEVIQCCIQQDSRKRPAMKEVIQKLREGIDISPEAGIPRLSPLWWAELEILSAEAA